MACKILMIVGLAIALGGCGTNVRWLMTQDSRLVVEADRALRVAESLGTGLEGPVYDAEAAKSEACHFIHEAVIANMRREPTFGEQFRTDLSTLIVLLVPIGQVERCADAFDAYRASVASLQRRLVTLGAMPPGSDVAQTGAISLRN